MESAYSAEDDELADLSADAAAAEKVSAKRAALLPSPVEEAVTEPEFIDPPSAKIGKKLLPQVANGELAALASSASVESVADQSVADAQNSAVPRPRLKPRAVWALAQAKAREDGDINIQPASAPPEETWSVKKPSQVADTRVSDSLGTIPAAETLIEDEADYASAAPEVNADGKTSLAAELRDGTADELVIIRPVLASFESDTPSWWSLLYSNAEASARRDGLPPALDGAKSDVLPIAAMLGPDGTGPAASLRLQQAADGKEDSQIVVREGKSSLPENFLQLSARDSDQDASTLDQ